MARVMLSCSFPGMWGFVWLFFVGFRFFVWFTWARMGACE